MYISKVNSNHEKQIILLVIPNEEKEGWLYFSVNWIFALLHRTIRVIFLAWIVFIVFESLIKKIDGCGNNPENSSVIKIGEHIPCGYPRKQIYFIS